MWRTKGLGILLTAMLFAACAADGGRMETSTPPEESRAEMVVDQTVRALLDEGYLEDWSFEVEHLYPVFRIDDEYDICARSVRGDYGVKEYTFVLHRGGRYDNGLSLRTGQATPLLSLNQMIHGQTIDETSYGLLVGDQMLLFDAKTHQPIGQQPAPALAAEHILLPDYPIWRSARGSRGYTMAELDDQYRIAYEYSTGSAYIEGVGIINDSFFVFLEDRKRNLYTPLLYRDGYGSPEVEASLMAGGRFCLRMGGAELVLDQSTRRPLAYYPYGYPYEKEPWYPVAACPYRGGSVALGAVGTADGEAAFYGFSITEKDGGQRARTTTVLPFAKEFYYLSLYQLTPHCYGDHLMFTDLPGGELVSIDLLTGGVETEHADVIYYTDAGVVTIVRDGGEWLPSGERAQSFLTVSVWEDGRRTQRVRIDEPIDPAYQNSYFSTEGEYEAAQYDPQAKMVALDRAGRRYLIELATGKWSITNHFPAEPQHVYAVSEDGRYTVGSIFLGGAGDGHEEELYVLDNQTKQTRALQVVGGGYGYWGLISLTNSMAAVCTYDGAVLYELTTGNAVLRLEDQGESEHNVGVAYDPQSQRYYKAVVPNAWGVESEALKQLRIAFDVYDPTGRFERRVTTDCRPSYQKFAHPANLQLSLYGDELLFWSWLYETEGEQYFPSSSVLSRWNLRTGAVATQKCDLFWAQDDILIVGMYARGEKGQVQEVSFERYKDQTLDGTVVAPLTQELGYLDYNRETGCLTGGDGWNHEQRFDLTFNSNRE